MADDLSSLLSWFANYSNYYSVLTILLCFIVMVVFILRLNNENMFLNISPLPQLNLASEKRVTDLQNPFSVQISTGKRSSLKDGVYLKVSVLQSCTLHVYWGVDLEAFHKALQEPWQQILNGLERNNWLDESTLLREENQELHPGEYLERHINCPSEVTAETLGVIPRKKYPAIVITSLSNLEHSDSFEEHQIVAMFNVIHLKDEICQLDSHIINKYLMTTSSTVPVCVLQSLFVSTSPDVSTDSSQTAQMESQVVETLSAAHQETDLSTAYQDTPQSTNADTPKECCDENGSTDSTTQTLHNIMDALDTPQCNECIVCQSAPVTFALLPCRHACICDFCLKQVERCPMCRGYIDSYFRMKDCKCNENSGETNEQELIDNSAVNLRYESWWEKANRRLNDYFGFT